MVAAPLPKTGSVKFDSELMTNYVPALPCPPGSHFVACLDPSSRRPLVFSITADTVPQLNVIKDVSGINKLVNLGPLLGLSKTTAVVAFDCQQSNDLTIYLCVAVRDDANSSRLLVVKPFRWMDSSTLKLEVLPPRSMDTIDSIKIGPPDAGHDGYPIILVNLAARPPPNARPMGSDIMRVLVNPSLTSWSTLRDMNLPENASRIIDIAPAANGFGSGIFVLYEIGSVPSLIGEFVRHDTDQNDGSLFWYTVKLSAPTSPTSIATLTDQRGRSELLVSGASGLHRWSCAESTRRNEAGLIINIDNSFRQAQSLRIAQDTNLVTVWSLGSNGQLGYFKAELGSMKDIKPTLLLPSQKTTGFAVTVSNPVGGPQGQTVVTDDETGNLKYMQQFSDTLLWHEQQLYFADTAHNVPVPSYNVTLQGYDSRGNPVSSGFTLALSTSSSTHAMINGKTVTLSRKPQSFPLDETGEISILISTQDLSSQTVKVLSMSDAHGSLYEIQPLSIDPSVKVINALATKLENDDLATAKTQSGQPLWESGETPPQGDLDKATTLIQQLKTVTDSLTSQPGTPQGRQDNTHSEESSGDQNGTQAENSATWYYVKTQASMIIDPGVKQIDAVWNFTCTLADSAITWVLDTIEKVGQALAWVWAKIKLGIDKLIEYVGFLFSWDDILDAKDTIVNVTNAVLDFSASKIDTLGPYLDRFFNYLDSHFDGDSSGNDQHTSQQGSEDSPMHGTAVKWISERLKNGGAEDSSTTSQNASPSNDSINDFFDNQLTTASTALSDTIHNAGSKISDYFTNSGAGSIADLLAQLASDAARTIIAALRALAHGLLSVAKQAITMFRDFGNMPIDIPVITPLYSMITKGESLTLLHALSLVIAIPTTIIYKIITGTPLPKLSATDIRPIFLQFAFTSHMRPLVATLPSAERSSEPSSTLTSHEQSIEDGLQAMVQGQDPTPAQQADLQSEMTKQTGQKSFKDLSDLQRFMKVFPIITAGIAVGAAVIVPPGTVIKAAWAQRQYIKKLSAMTPLAVTSQIFDGSKIIRYILLGCSFVSSGVSVYTIQVSQAIDREIRTGSSCLTVFKCLVGAVLLAANNRPGATGGIDRLGQTEKLYQHLAAGTAIASWIMYVKVYADEVADANSPTPHYKLNDKTCSALGLTGATLLFVGSMADYVVYWFFMPGSANIDGAIAATCVGAGSKFTAGILQAARFGIQMDQVYVPSLMTT